MLTNWLAAMEPPAFAKRLELSNSIDGSEYVHVPTIEADLPLLSSEPITPESSEPVASDVLDKADDVAPVVPSVEELCPAKEPVPHPVKTDAETSIVKAIIELFVFMSFLFCLLPQ